MGVVGDSIANLPSVSSSFTVLKKESQNLHPADKNLLSIQCVIHTIIKSFSIIVWLTSVPVTSKIHPLSSFLSHSRFRIFYPAITSGWEGQVLLIHYFTNCIIIQCTCKLTHRLKNQPKLSFFLNLGTLQQDYWCLTTLNSPPNSLCEGNFAKIHLLWFLNFV